MNKIFTKILLLASFCLMFGSVKEVSAQQLLPKEANTVKTLPQLQKEFNEKWDKYNVKNGYYLENGEKKKAPGWKLFKRSEYYWEQRIDLKTGEFPKTTAQAEYEKVENSLKKTNFTSSWNSLGSSSSAGGYAGIGRINCITFHPTDANTIWVGTPAGGIWKTTNGGTSWTILNNNEAVIGVSVIVVDPTDTDIIYIATGDRDRGSMATLSGGQAADNVSIGILKSTDGGATWNTTGLTYATSDGKLVYDLIMDPSNHLILLATTSDGILKSIDGGANWIVKTANPVMDLEFKPGNPNIVYGSSRNYGDTYVFRSDDKGETWAFPIVAVGGRRGEIAVTPDNPDVVYLLAANTGGGVLGVYKSSDSGLTWGKVNGNSATEPGMLGYYTDGRAPATGQGSYDWCIAVSPTDENTVFIGGITSWKSTDGGVTWAAINNWTSGATYNISGVATVHADKHSLIYQPTTNVLFEGNDGGIYKTTNGGTTWSDLTNGMVISQLYRIGVSQTVSNKTMTGLQDNGSKLLNGATWSDVTGGDGMECIIDYTDANFMFGTYTEGQILRSINGTTFQNGYITANIPGGQPAGAWVTPYVLHPTTSATLFAGFDKVWKTADRGDTWTSASQVLSGTTLLRSLAIAPSNGDILYAADQSNMWKTTDGGATNWTALTLPALNNSITYIAVHATNPDIVWFTVGGYTAGQKVFQSVDGGANWTNISGATLPNLPVMSIVHYKKATDRNVLFISTDIGVYTSEQALPAPPPTALSKVNVSDWSQYNTGLPNVVVSELEIYYAPSGPDKLRAGTFGRGLWETDIDAALPVELTSFSANSVEGNRVSLQWETATEVNNYGFEIERQNSNKINKLSELNADDWKSIGFIEGHGNSNSTKLYSFIDESISGGSNFVYRLKQIDIDGKYEYSDLVEIKVVPVNFELTQNYPNPFNPTTKIKYSVPVKSQISLTIFDVLGREITKLVNEVKETGVYEASFDASKLSSGIYYYSLHSGDFAQTKKMMLVK